MAYRRKTKHGTAIATVDCGGQLCSTLLHKDSVTRENGCPLMIKRNEMKLKSCLPLTAILATTAFHGSLGAHEWTDKSGHYRVEAELVTANKELVVLRTSDHRLIAVDLIQLSEADQVLVRLKINKTVKSSKPAKPVEPIIPLSETPIVADSLPKPLPEIAKGKAVAEPTSKQPTSTQGGEWILIDGQRTAGEFIGFDLKPLSIKRLSAEVYVGGVLFSQLDPIAKHTR